MNNEINNTKSRRDFVKQSSIIAGGLIAAPLLSQANYFSGAAGEIKIALIGCGGRGTGAALEALLTKQNVKLVAMADAFRDRLDGCYKTLTSDDLSDWGKGKGNVKTRVDVPEERKYTGFDAYAKAIEHASFFMITTPTGFRHSNF